MIVVDTSVLIDFLRGIKNSGSERFRALETERVPFALPAICIQEILQRAKDEKEWALLSEYLGTQRVLVPYDPSVAHVQAARIFFDCRRVGLTIRSSNDCLIAQLVLEEDGILLHSDSDFESICKVRPLRTLPS